MKINNVLRMFFAALFLTFAVTSCEDDYSEEELLRQQNQLEEQRRAAEQAAEDAAAEGDAANLTEQQQDNLAALNLAGELLDFSVTVTSDNGPVTNATIMVTNVKGETATATTDENGNVTLQDVSMGGHTITMKSDEVVDLSFEIDFGGPVEDVNYEVVDGVVYPIETSHSASITAFRLTGAATSTIKGKITAETDVTNKTPEIPQDLTVEAVFSDANAVDFVEISSTTEEAKSMNLAKTLSGVKIVEKDFGVAIVDNATGDYEMTVPVLKDSNNNTVGYDIIIPDFEAEATVAYTNDDDEVVIGSFPALFGENRSGASDAVYAANLYADLKVEFSEPAPQGEGFSLVDFEVIKRNFMPLNFDATTNASELALTTDKDSVTFTSSTTYNSSAQVYNGDNNTKITVTRGSGYQTQPEVTISGGGLERAAHATAEVDVEYLITDINVSDGGTGFSIGDLVTIDVQKSNVSGTYSKSSNIPGVTLRVEEINADTGAITEVSYPSATFSYAVELTYDELLADVTAATDSSSTPVDITSNSDYTEPEFELVYDGRVETFRVLTDGDSEYTSNPTITIEGNATAEAVLDFRYTYDTGDVTTPYVYVPKVELLGTEIDGTTDIESEIFHYLDSGDDIVIPSTNTTIESNLLVETSTTNTGDVIIDSGLSSYAKGITAELFTDVPTVKVTDVKHVQASAKVGPNSINGSGEFVGFVDDAGVIVATSSTNSDFTLGKGYVEAPTVTFTTLVDGEELDIDVTLTTTTVERGKDWNGVITIDDAGSGLDDDLNNSNLTTFSFPFRSDNVSGSTAAPGTDPETGTDYGPLEFTPQPGQTLIRNINYGKGFLIDSTIQ